MDSHSKARMLLMPNAKQSQQDISREVGIILASNPNRSPEEVLRAATLQVLAPSLERLLVTSEDEQGKAHKTALHDIQQEASSRVQSIFANRERLGLIVEIHGDVLQKRWKKRTTNQRKNLLLQAWPGMSEVHRPDFDALREQRSLGTREEQIRHGYKYRDAYLFPRVNLDDLSNNKYLLLFIESRVRNDPEAFAWSDSQHLQMAASASAIKLIRGDGYTMMLSGQKTPETYGHIVSWDSHLDSVHDLLTGKGFPLGEGLIVLEIQDRILKFLVACTESMFVDMGIQAIPTSDLAQSASTVGSELSLDNAMSPLEQHAELQSMVEVNTEAAYRQPQRLSLGYLRKLASAKKDEAEDEIWMLREDPSYFQDVLEARCKMITYLIGEVKRAPLTQLRKEKILDEACRAVIHDPYKNLIIWDIILADLQKLENLDTRTVTSSVEPLPEEYQDALANFVLAMDKLAEYPLEALRKILPMSEPMRQYFDRTLNDDNSITYKFREGVTIPSILVFVYDLLHEDRTNTMGVSNILDGIERIMGQDGGRRDLITAEVAKTLSETAAIGEIHARLGHHQPRIQLPMDLDLSLAKVESRIEIIATIKKKLIFANLGAFVTPFPKFEYPPLGKTQKNADRIRAEEAMLDTFWHEADQHFLTSTGKTLIGLMDDRITEREIQRTPPWQPPVARPKSKKAAAPEPTAEEIEALRTFESGTESSTALPARPKEKEKTRGVAQPPLEPVAAQEPEVEEPQAQTFALPKGPYKIMRAFFPADVQDRTGSKVLWKDFVFAMQKLDFSIKSLDGSASQFEPAWKPDSPIILHEPHPGHEIRFNLLRRFAGRLSRRYGWTAETFVPT